MNIDQRRSAQIALSWQTQVHCTVWNNDARPNGTQNPNRKFDPQMQSKKVHARRKHVFRNYEITNMNHMNGISRKADRAQQNFSFAHTGCPGKCRYPLEYGF